MQNYNFFSFLYVFRVHFYQIELTLLKNMMLMRHFLTILCAMLLLSSCATNRNSASGKALHPDDVFTITEEDIARETRQINSTIKGVWTYSGPSVDVSGKDILSSLGKPLAKGKLKKKLKNAYKKIGLNKVRPQFSFNEDGTCAIQLLGTSMNGTYNYNPSQGKITFKWHGIPLTARLKRDGKKKVSITFDADKLLKLVSLASKVSDNSAIKALSFLMDHYDDVMVGFELKK